MSITQTLHAAYAGAYQLVEELTELPDVYIPDTEANDAWTAAWKLRDRLNNMRLAHKKKAEETEQ